MNQTQYVINSQPALSQVLVKTEASGTQTYYVYGLGLIGQEQEGEYLSYHFDLRGSTVALSDETGQVLERFQYSPYGMLLSGEASTTPFLFNGKYGVMTDSNGLYYMRARFYSPSMRRFVNQDVLLGNIFEGQTLNRYAYVTGQPVSFVDPFGLFPHPIVVEEINKWIDIYHTGIKIEKEVQKLIKELVGLGYLPEGHRNTTRDAVRHCTAACRLGMEIDRPDAEIVQHVFEFLGDVIKNTTAEDKFMDYHNNGCGFDFAEAGAISLRDCANACMNALNNGTLVRQMDLDDPFWTVFKDRIMERLYLK